MQKRTYHIPTVEITKLCTERMMAMGDPSTKPHIPVRRDPAF